MKKKHHISLALWLLVSLEGLAALVFSLYWGIISGRGITSLLWWGVTGVCFCLWIAIITSGGIYFLKGKTFFLLKIFQRSQESHHVFLLWTAVLFGAGLLSVELFLFSWMFLPEYFRWIAFWGILSAIQGWVMLRLQCDPARWVDAWKLPDISHLDPGQKKVMWILAGILLINFILTIPGNFHGTQDAGRFRATSEDEVVIYPILITMLTPSGDFRTDLYRLIEYEDYHYGYPFFVVSAIVILPSRILFGPGFESEYHINIPLLRQLVSVLPLLLSAFIITFLATRFRLFSASVITLLLMLTIPAVLRYEYAFWHADALTVLCVALTLYFLDRDRLRFRSDFYLAAFFCGLASAIRLVGFFFALTIAGYLVVGWIRGRGVGKTLAAGTGFISVMVLTILLSNPFLFDAGARGRMADILAQKSMEMANGYGDPDPHAIYQTGWETWLPFLEKDYGPPWFLGFLAFSTVFAALIERQRGFPALLLGWVLMMGGYLVYFVAVKSFQYGLPAFIPLYGSAFLILDTLKRADGLSRFPPGAFKIIQAFLYLVCLAQLTWNILLMV